MSTSYVYGVFKTEEKLANALAALRLRGFKDAAVRREHDCVLYRPVDKEPMRKAFIWSGSVGAILGGIAGAVASPTLTYNDTFQVLTPMMAMVAGGALNAYLGVWLCGFLRVLDKPVDESEPLAGNAESTLILAIEAETRDQKQLAMECLELNEADEIVVRSAELGKLEAIKAGRSHEPITEPQNAAAAVQLAA